MLDGLLRDEHGLGENILVTVGIGGVDVSAGATDLRQHLMRDPTLEPLHECLRFRFFHIGDFTVED